MYRFRPHGRAGSTSPGSSPPDGPLFTIDEVTEITDDMTLLQDERYGATYSFNYVDSNDITFINCFDFGENSRTLDKVLFETKSNGADYEIYYIPVRDGVPSNDESEWKSVASGKVAYSGYQSVDANGFVAPLGRGAVGVRIKTNSEESSQLGSRSNPFFCPAISNKRGNPSFFFFI